MKLPFFKMQAQGNDYLYFDLRDHCIPEIDFTELSRHICDRHFGVGADGIVLIQPSLESDAFMRIFNADGSEAEMCGSALRSVCGYLSEITKKESYLIDTISGVKKGFVWNEYGVVKVKVDMGIPKLLKASLSVAGFVGDYIDMGNPHFVIFTEELPGKAIPEIASAINKAEYFQNGINIEFAIKEDSTRVSVQIWERGSGITLACGTGACAVAYAGLISRGYAANLQISVPGGIVETVYDPLSNHIFLIGDVVHVFNGTYPWQSIRN